MNRNIPAFILFRVFFNARFYYPVFTILFLDYGLTLEQFSILNLVWAATIVLAEVPSGALADIVGRRNLVVFAAILMFIEMALIAFVPLGSSSLLFWVFFFNRICSGLAEAAASGADEALAYDTLKCRGEESEWPRLLEKTTRALSAGFFCAMIIGAISYDHETLNRAFAWLGLDWQLAAKTTLRFPVYATLATSIIVLAASLLMVEPPRDGENPVEGKGPAAGNKLERLRESFVRILEAGRWTLSHRFVLFVILGGLILDSTARQLIILASEYYRVIDIPTAGFGFIGALMALLGIAYARLGRHLVEHRSPTFNFLFLSGLLLFGLVGVSFTIPWWGLIFALCTFSMMSLVAFLQSHYINRHVGSRHRATVLSFKGLALNLGLGFASLLYSGWIAFLKRGAEAIDPDKLKEVTFVQSLKGFPLYFLALFLVVLFLARRLKPDLRD